ncbi:MAG: 16S rRNA (guanine(527)-N(7))-methyltransferase RsmG [Succinivibrio sp.]|nr:16S rRNA (guanine(527)-N(7))-methyltransferase RsmG [Succinivibrio sp.]
MKKTEIECSEEQYDKLATLVELLAKWNNALNLTAIREIDKMVVLHILDSAVVSPLISDKGKNIADVGTGAGFPGLVLAILNPQKHFTLIDSVAKKLSFVRTAMVSLGLKNVTIINDRCENIKVEQKFDCILSRAFAPLCKIIEWCENLIDDNGLFVAMKANLEEGELNDLPENAEILENIPLLVPGLDAKRQAVVMRIKK